MNDSSQAWAPQTAYGNPSDTPGSTCLLAALSAREGTVASDADAWKATTGHLSRISQESCHRSRSTSALTSLSTICPSKHPDAMAWVSRRRRLALHFTPDRRLVAQPGNRNLVSLFLVAQDVVKGGIWRSKQELV